MTLTLEHVPYDLNSGSMVPRDELLPDVLPTERLNERAVAVRAIRDELRTIPTGRNTFTVAGALLQTFGVVGLAAWRNTWWSYTVAWIWMGRGHALLNILGHEAAHRLLFPNQRVNDFVGRWLLAYPTLQALQGYRRAHFAHHRDEMGPKEPDASLYAGYPITADSWKRKLWRDFSGQSAYKNFSGLARAVRARRPEALQILGVQAAMMAVAAVTRRPLAYVVWLASWSSWWRVSNRLRAIAEHGGLERSEDRRRTTHVIRQSPLARFTIVPYNTGLHLAHHVDMGVPWSKLGALHRELVRSGWITPDIEYPSYWAFWRACSSAADQPAASAMAEGSSFLSFAEDR